MTNNEMIELAIRIASEAHSGQTDLDGRAVILHPMAVASMGQTDEEVICGWLHDVVEDSCKPRVSSLTHLGASESGGVAFGNGEDNPHYSFESLLERGFSEEIVSALQLLTHDKSEPYMDYVARIAASGNRLAIATKLHDLQHNLARGRAGGHTKQVEKHSRALPIIEAAYNRLCLLTIDR